MSFSIRQVTVADAGAIVALMNPILEAKKYSIMTGPLSVEVQSEFILRLPDRCIYLAIDEILMEKLLI